MAWNLKFARKRRVCDVNKMRSQVGLGCGQGQEPRQSAGELSASRCPPAACGHGAAGLEFWGERRAGRPAKALPSPHGEEATTASSEPPLPTRSRRPSQRGRARRLLCDRRAAPRPPRRAGRSRSGGGAILRCCGTRRGAAAAGGRWRRER